MIISVPSYLIFHTRIYIFVKRAYILIINVLIKVSPTFSVEIKQEELTQNCQYDDYQQQFLIMQQ